MSNEETYVDILRKRVQYIRELTRDGELPPNKRAPLVLFTALEYAISFDEQHEDERKEAFLNDRDPIPRFKDAKLLEQLANLILHEDLTNKSRGKVRAVEYPFLSDMQLARRQSGANSRNDGLNLGETDFGMADTMAQDGRNYKSPVRRKLSVYESIKVDEQAKIRNKERFKKYRDFTKTQPVHTFYVGEILT